LALEDGGLDERDVSSLFCRDVEADCWLGLDLMWPRHARQFKM
jgi:hypothetical protein